MSQIKHDLISFTFSSHQPSLQSTSADMLSLDVKWIRNSSHIHDDTQKGDLRRGWV